MVVDGAPILFLTALRAHASRVQTPVTAPAPRQWLAVACYRVPSADAGAFSPSSAGTVAVMDVFQRVTAVQIMSPNPIKRIYSPR